MIKNGPSIINHDVVVHCAQESVFRRKKLNLDIDWSDFERTTAEDKGDFEFLPPCGNLCVILGFFFMISPALSVGNSPEDRSGFNIADKPWTACQWTLLVSTPWST